MTHYFIGLGSNIAPYRNVEQMLQALLRFLPEIHISRILETCPVGIPAAPKFLNLAASFLSEKDEKTLKDNFNRIEISLGRDRHGVESKSQSRTADIDILFKLGARVTSVPPPLIPGEPYMRPVVLQLLEYLGIDSGEIDAGEIKPGVDVEVAGITVGKSPVTLQMHGQRIVVRNNNIRASQKTDEQNRQ